MDQRGTNCSCFHLGNVTFFYYLLSTFFFFSFATVIHFINSDTLREVSIKLLQLIKSAGPNFLPQ